MSIFYYVILFDLDIAVWFVDFSFTKEIIKWIFVLVEDRILRGSPKCFYNLSASVYMWSSIISIDNYNKIKLMPNSENIDNFVRSALSNI